MTTNIHFQRRKDNRSFSLLLTVIVIILLLLFVPLMLINRTKTIINHKLENAQTDTTYIKLVSAGLSYLETADAFVIFRSKDEDLRQQLLNKAVERFTSSCKNIDSAQTKQFCHWWSKILTKKQIDKCPVCAGK